MKSENDSHGEVIGGESPSGKSMWKREERKKLYKDLTTCWAGDDGRRLQKLLNSERKEYG